MLKIKNEKNIKIIKAIFGFILFFSSSYIKNIIISFLNLKKVGVKTSLIVSTITNVIILLILTFFYFKDLKNEFKIYKKNLSDNIDVGIKYWLIGLAGMIVSNIFISFIFNGGQAANEQAVQKMIDTLPFVVLFSAGVLAPIIEEILFRKTFKDIIKNSILCVLVSGFIFGYLHVIGAKSLIQFLYIIPYSSLGIGFAIMYQKTDTVFTSITMHMFHNIVLTLISILI